jgi:hypothetical protein
MVSLAYIWRGVLGVFGGAEAAGAHRDEAGFCLDAEEAVGVETGCDAGAGLRAVDVDAFAADPGGGGFDLRGNHFDRLRIVEGMGLQFQRFEEGD